MSELNSAKRDKERKRERKKNKNNNHKGYNQKDRKGDKINTETKRKR